MLERLTVQQPGDRDSGGCTRVVVVICPVVFSGKPSQDCENEQNSVCLEVLLVKVCHKKRKVCKHRIIRRSEAGWGRNGAVCRTGCELSSEAGACGEEAGSPEPGHQTGILPLPAGSQQ